MMHQKWINDETRKTYSQINSNMNPNDASYITLKHQFLDKMNDDKLNDQIKCFNGLTSDKDGILSMK